MEPKKLAKAVVHWLEFERLCGRERLFTEAALKTPVHQHLTASEPFDVFLEEGFPGLPRGLLNVPGRKKSLDFCLRRHGGAQAYQHVLESKFVTNRRSFAQEVLDDLYRLRWLRLRGQTEPCQRWVLIAGLWQDLKSQILDKGSTRRRPATDTGLYGVLHRTPQTLHTVDVRNSPPKQRRRWAKAAEKLLQRNLPSKFKTRLEAIFPEADQSSTDFTCIIWRVIKPVRRRNP